MDGTAHEGFHVDDGTYETYAKNVDPVGDDVGGASEQHLAPHTQLGGDGFSAMGGESGFTGAYASRMQSLQERVGRLGGQWHHMAEAARQTRDNYQGVEDDHQSMMNKLGKELS